MHKERNSLAWTVKISILLVIFCVSPMHADRLNTVIDYCTYCLSTQNGEYPWSLPFFHTLTLDGGGKVEVRYRIRRRNVNCTSYPEGTTHPGLPSEKPTHEIFLETIIPVDLDANSTLAAMTTAMVLRTVELLLVEENPMFFPAHAQSTSEWARIGVVKYSCWGRKPSDDPNCFDQYYPCQSFDCCVMLYDVHYDRNLRLRTVAIDSYHANEEGLDIEQYCPDEPETAGLIDCEFVCAEP